MAETLQRWPVGGNDPRYKSYLRADRVTRTPPDWERVQSAKPKRTRAARASRADGSGAAVSSARARHTIRQLQPGLAELSRSHLWKLPEPSTSWTRMPAARARHRRADGGQAPAGLNARGAHCCKPATLLAARTCDARACSALDEIGQRGKRRNRHRGEHAASAMLGPAGGAVGAAARQRQGRGRVTKPAANSMSSARCWPGADASMAAAIYWGQLRPSR